MESAATHNELANELLKLAEERYGKRMKKKYHGVVFASRPQLCGDDVIGYTISLSYNAYENINNFRFECSHELIHLLTPTSNWESITFLEEGIAVDFSIEVIKFYNTDSAIIDRYLCAVKNEPKYYRAYNLIKEIKPNRSEIIKKIRTEYPETLLSDLTKRQLKKYTEIPKNIIPELLNKFDTDSDESCCP
ncbi:hypothetical protein [Mucilaginibacter lappiensis]|uniref:Uncharacterized protein n=1 Tax=Mucilaginibacter lappiensis TaxID=354630 RepID=A0A841JE85_9SPHI|nr:hypothetical protein [Mucilaginibacter lappiensis]MBB6129469.1 hypothetical protein [Mucilaginibacter lappiensis]